MNTKELVKKCVDEINVNGNDATIIVELPATGSTSNKRRLIKNYSGKQPIGEALYCDYAGGRDVVQFNAVDILAFFAAKKLIDVAVEVKK
jgi:hypothetical protein